MVFLMVAAVIIAIGVLQPITVIGTVDKRMV